MNPICHGRPGLATLVVEMWLATLELDDDISKRVPLMTGAEMVYEMVYMYIYIYDIYIGDIFWGYLIYVFFFQRSTHTILYIYMGYVRDIFM